MPELPLVQKILIWAVPVIFAITVHEVAHGWVASKLGDQTARLSGRLTLNPIRHMDPVGTVLVPLIMLAVSNFVFGWAKPVPVDYRNLNRPRRDMALVAAAGPAANLLMMIFWFGVAVAVVASRPEAVGIPAALFYMSLAGITINIVLIVLNLLPLPPLDGSRVVSAFLKPAWAYRYNLLERWGLVILVALIFTGILGKILLPPVAFVQTFLYNILASV